MAPWNKQPVSERFWTKARRAENGCLLWQATKVRGGYGVVRDGKMKLAHRVAWELVNGDIPNGLHVCHRCDTPACVNPEHLFLGTRFDNLQDAVRKGRAGMHKLTLVQIAEIRKLYGAGEIQRSLATAFGISQANVSCIVTDKIWRLEVLRAST